MVSRSLRFFTAFTVGPAAFLAVVGVLLHIPGA